MTTHVLHIPRPRPRSDIPRDTVPAAERLLAQAGESAHELEVRLAREGGLIVGFVLGLIVAFALGVALL